MTNFTDKLPTSETRNVKVSLETAKRWKELGGEFGKIALETFPELNVRNEWEERFICENIQGFYIGNDAEIYLEDSIANYSEKGTFRTEKQAKSALAYAQLTQLMALPEYNGDWVPDWTSDSVKNVIHRRGFGLYCDFNYDIYIYHPIAFKSKAVCEKFFYKNFDLLKEYFEL